nr:DUF1592 domain-containing protein [Deltaproteobacteria bacterium]
MNRRTIYLAFSLLMACRDGAVDASPTTTGSTGEPDETTETGEPDSEPEAAVPPPGGMRRLLARQYLGSVEYLLGVEAADAARSLLPADPTLGGLDAVAATELPVAPSAIEGYEDTAFAVARAVVDNPAVLSLTVPCITEPDPGTACYRSLAERFGRLAFRRSLADGEIDALAQLAREASQWDDNRFTTGVEYELAAILQAPSFLYIVETGEVDESTGQRTLRPHELATRMSLFLIGRTPGRFLLDMADAGQLQTDEEIRDAAWTLLELPEARETVRQFYDELFTLRDLADKGKNATLFPTWSPELAEAMRQETLLLLEHVIFDVDDDYRDVLAADYTFMDAQLAAIYGVEPPDGPGHQRVPLPEGLGRVGVLTQPALLALLSHADRNSPTRRGLFVQQTLLCAEIGSPPPTVNPELPEPDPDVTLREQLQEVVADPSCAACHTLMDPIGFAFEGFDAVGAEQATDNGLPIDDRAPAELVGGTPRPSLVDKSGTRYTYYPNTAMVP